MSCLSRQGVDLCNTGTSQYEANLSLTTAATNAERVGQNSHAIFARLGIVI